MNRIAFADKTGIFAWSDAQNCRDTLPQRYAASRFMELVFSKFNTDATSLNGRMTGATCEFELNRDIPNDWVSTSKNEDGTVRLEIQAHVCAVPEPICRGLTVMRFPVWSNEPVGIPLSQTDYIYPRYRVGDKPQGGWMEVRRTGRRASLDRQAPPGGRPLPRTNENSV